MRSIRHPAVGETHVTRMQKGSLCSPTRQTGLGPAPLGHQFASVHDIELYLTFRRYGLKYDLSARLLQGRDTHKAVSDGVVSSKASVRSQVSPVKWHWDRLLSQAAETKR